MSNTDNHSGLLDTGEIAHRLKVAPATLRSWRMRNEGPAYYKVGRKVLYDPAEVDAWVRDQRVAAAQLAHSPSLATVPGR